MESPALIINENEDLNIGLWLGNEESVLASYLLKWEQLLIETWEFCEKYDIKVNEISCEISIYLLQTLIEE